LTDISMHGIEAMRGTTNRLSIRAQRARRRISEDKAEEVPRVAGVPYATIGTMRGSLLRAQPAG